MVHRSNYLASADKGGSLSDACSAGGACKTPHLRSSNQNPPMCPGACTFTWTFFLKCISIKSVYSHNPI